jgi:hypothetical protein
MNYLNFHTGRPRFHFEGEPPPPTPPPTPPPPAWHAGLDTELIGHANNKGWKLDDPKEAFGAAAKVARDLERHFGVPPEQLLKMPKPDAAPAEKAAFRQKLGWPAEAKDYDFSTVKDATGQPIAQPLADALRASFHAHGIAKDTAPAVAADVVKALDSVSKTQSTLNDARLAEQRAELDKNWGGKESNTYRFNLLQAKEGASRLGLDQDAVAALESQLGYPKLMDALRRIGNARKEDIFVHNEQVNSPGNVVTREGAVARKSELFADKAWVTRFNSGDAEAKAEWKRLNYMIEGESV